MNATSVACTTCGHRRECLLHTRAKYPAVAARAYLWQRCPRASMEQKQRPCAFALEAWSEAGLVTQEEEKE